MVSSLGTGATYVITSRSKSRHLRLHFALSLPLAPFLSILSSLHPVAANAAPTILLVFFLSHQTPFVHSTTMNRPLRSKRNFKALQLEVSNSPPQSPSDPDPVPTRLAPASKQAAGGAKKRPPPMNLKPKAAADMPPASISSAVDGFVAVAPTPSSAPATGTSSAGAKRMTYHTTLSNTLASLDLNAEVKYDLRDEDLKDLHELGQGNGGSVKKVEHVPSRTIMAKKVFLPPPPSPLGALTEFRQIVLIDAKPSVRKQILRELQIMHDCHSGYIISFYGAFLSDPNICICMEYMDKGSLDGIYKQIGPIDIEVVAKVAHAVLEGLTYLYDAHRIIHRGAYVTTGFRGSVIDTSDDQISNHPIFCVIQKAKSKYVILAFRGSSSIRSQILSSGLQPI